MKNISMEQGQTVCVKNGKVVGYMQRCAIENGDSILTYLGKDGKYKTILNGKNINCYDDILGAAMAHESYVKTSLKKKPKLLKK